MSQMTVGYDESVVGSLQAMRPWVEGRFPKTNPLSTKSQYDME
jgi:hypothetical protein